MTYMESLQEYGLSFSKSAENGFGAASMAVSVDGLETAPIRSLWSRTTGLKSMDFDHGWLRARNCSL